MPITPPGYNDERLRALTSEQVELSLLSPGFRRSYWRRVGRPHWLAKWTVRLTVGVFVLTAAVVALTAVVALRQAAPGGRRLVLCLGLSSPLVPRSQKRAPSGRPVFVAYMV